VLIKYKSNPFPADYAIVGFCPEAVGDAQFSIHLFRTHPLVATGSGVNAGYCEDGDCHQEHFSAG
jgi:hypothetical protein